MACQKDVSKEDIMPQQTKDTSTNEVQKKNIEQPKQITNGIVFKDAQGNILSDAQKDSLVQYMDCLLYTSPSPRDRQKSRMPSSA